MQTDGAKPEEMREAATKCAKNAAVLMAATTFNAVADEFLRNLLVIMPNDLRIKAIKEMLEKFANDEERMDVPALNFSKSVAETVDGKTVAELIFRRDERLFRMKKFPLLGEIDSHITEKWERLNQKNRDAIWVYLDKLVKYSASVLLVQKISPEDLTELVSSVETAVRERGKRIDVRDGAAYEKLQREVLRDPRLQQATSKFMNVLGQKQLR